ncbi:MAG TPA: hypothetical protein VIL46_04990 [Gemmataceae bacterium]
MILKRVETPGVELVTIPTGPNWKITHHRLFNVSPDNAEKVEVKGARVTIWDLCFVQDILQITNTRKGLLLDVGWYPHADPSGTYCLRLIRVYDGGAKGRDSYDWQNPVVDFETRSLNELIHKIQELIAS